MIDGLGRRLVEVAATKEVVEQAADDGTYDAADIYAAQEVGDWTLPGCSEPGDGR